MTEDEAKTMWCPFAGPNRYARQHENCEGSQCAAWRWLPLMCDDAWTAAVAKAATEIGDTSSNRKNAAAHVNKNRAQYGLPVRPFDGYCGLAGKP